MACSTSVRFGAYIATHGIEHRLADVARASEEGGLDSLWVGEHSHIPVARATPWPGGGELPDYYRRMLDPFVALTAFAVATTTLKVGIGITIVPQRDTISLAKSVASLDVVSKGRFLFGVGGGWNREEMTNHGVDFDLRWKIMDERIEALKVIWAKDEAEYHGEFVDFAPIWSWPKPATRPHPPILVGGSGAGAFRRVIAYGDEWMPVFSQARSFEREAEELQRLAAASGREPVPVTLFLAPTDAGRLSRWVEAGIDGFVFRVPPGGDPVDHVRRLGELGETIRAKS